MQPVDERSQESARFAGWSAAGLVGLILGAVGLAILVATVPLLALDRPVAAGLNALVAPHPALVDALKAVTELGATATALVVLATLAVALLARRQRRLAAYVAVTGLGGIGLSPAVKELVGRLRPVVENPVATAGGSSFPSGHAVTSTVTFGVLLLVLLPALPARARRPVVAATVAIVVLVGVTRLALGVHYLTDVLGGWLLGVAWLAVTTTAFRSWRRHLGLPVAPPSRGLAPEAAPDLAPAPDHTPTPVGPWTYAAQLLVVAVLLLGALLGMGLLVSRMDAGTELGEADVAAVRWFEANRTDTLDAVSTPVGELGNTTVVIVLGIVAAILALAVLRRWRPVLVLAVGLVGEVVLFISAVTIIGRPRPPVSHLDAELPPTSSFPSGHTGAAICLYGGVAILVLGATRAWWRWLVLALAVVVVVLVALARVYRGAHHPSDVVGSVLFAVPWLLASWYILRAPPGAADQVSVTARSTSARA